MTNGAWRQKAGFVHVHSTDNQLYDGSCVGNLVQVWWSVQTQQSNQPWVCENSVHLRTCDRIVSMALFLIFGFVDAKLKIQQRPSR